VLKVPLILSAARAVAVAARLACRVASGVFSTSPNPNSGVGMRKITLLVETAVAKSGCASEQPTASDRPVIVYRAWTPPSSAPLEVLIKRASRMGPSAVINDGTAFVAPSNVASAPCGFCTECCGLVSPGLLPPPDGSAWHCAQLLPLKVGPSPIPASPAT